MKDRNYIQEALTGAVIVFFGEDKVLVPNMVEDGLQDGFHVELHWMPSDATPATLGHLGDDHHSGLIQVDIKTPFGQGVGEAKEKVAILEGNFKAGRKIWYNNTMVTVRKTCEEPSYRKDQWWVTPVSVYWYARVNRGLQAFKSGLESGLGGTVDDLSIAISKYYETSTD